MLAVVIIASPLGYIVRSLLLASSSLHRDGTGLDQMT